MLIDNWFAEMSFQDIVIIVFHMFAPEFAVYHQELVLNTSPPSM